MGNILKQHAQNCRGRCRHPASFAILFILIVTCWHVAAQPVKFAYIHNAGDKWHLTSEVHEQVLVNNQLRYNTQILSKIIVEIREGDGQEGRLWNRYNIAELSKDSNVYAWSDEFEAEYFRDQNGRLSGIPEGAVIPAVRNIPVFPDAQVEIGSSWQADGTEVFDLEPAHGIPEVLEIDFTAGYEYAGVEEIDGRKFDVIEIDYEYSWNPDSFTQQRLRCYAIYPWEITGSFHQRVLWDARAGRNFAEEGHFSYTYNMSDGRILTYRGTSKGKAVYAEPLDRGFLVEEVARLAQDDIHAEVVDDGVKVSLEDINFYPDEAVMLPMQEEKLRGILGILSRCPSRDIRVVGHTAFVPGLGEGQELSEQRAEAIARCILDSGVRSRENVVTLGMGARKPVADNSTEQGRRRNRRVEIIILEN